MARAIYRICVLGIVCCVMIGCTSTLPNTARNRKLPVVALDHNQGLSVQTDLATLQSDDFSLDVGGQTFTSQVAPILVNAEQGTYHSTLELNWQEHGQEMRLYFYFMADATSWWVDEIRTYDVTQPGGWLYYTGPFFKTPRGQAFAGDVTLVSDQQPGTNTQGRLHFQNVQVTCPCRFPDRPDLHKP